MIPKRRISLWIALVVAAASGAVALFAAGPAGAAGCISVSTSHGSMTAAVYDTPVTDTTIDATGCQIGAYYDSAGSGDSVSSATIENAEDYGVFVDGGDSTTNPLGTAVSVDVTDSSIHNIGDVPFDGVQRGNAIYYYGYETAGTVSGAVSGDTVSQYQKGGIIVNGANADVTVTGNTVTGLGPVDFIAQNGVQFGFGATGSARGNTVTDNDYTGCSNQDSAKTGCIPYVSTGILLYDIAPNLVSTSANQYRDDQRNLYVGPEASVNRP